MLHQQAHGHHGYCGTVQLYEECHHPPNHYQIKVVAENINDIIYIRRVYSLRIQPHGKVFYSIIERTVGWIIVDRLIPWLSTFYSSLGVLRRSLLYRSSGIVEP